MSSIHEELSWRGLIFQESDSPGIQSLLASGPQHVYAGFDPTANSLHIGNLVPLIALRRFQLAGHAPIAVLGGGTGLIGDPSGKASERNLNEQEIVESWVASIKEQIARFVDFSGKQKAHLVNNYDWIGRLSAIEYLRDLGKYFPVNWMLAKESVRSRIEREDGGISYTEFSYMILQAFDFLNLAEAYNCRLQVGGSDQWGNMVAGIELIRRKLAKDSFALTFPLITTASGAKFGKTEQGTVWLDPARTSPYSYYQFWINVDDRDVVRFLKFFTFASAEEIESLERSTQARPEERQAQKRLAVEMTRLTHGETELNRVQRAANALFGAEDLESIDEATLDSALDSAPQINFKKIEDIPAVTNLLVSIGIVKSNSEARRVINEGGVYLNNQRIADPKLKPTQADLLNGRILILRRGKKNYGVVRLEA